MLKMQNLSVQLGGLLQRKAKLLEDISCEIAQRQLVGVIGPNGAGKSTLLKSVAGIQAFTGSVRFFDKDLAKLPVAARARQLAYLPQAEVPAWQLSVRDLVSIGRLPWRGEAEDKSVARVAAAMDKTDSAALAERTVDTLSGGELKRVQVARLLASSAPLLVADEPIAALDLAHQWQVMELLRREARAGRTLLVAIHDLALAARFCDRLLLLDRGRLHGFGTPQQILNEENLANVFGVDAALRNIDGVPVLMHRGLRSV
ncbi:ABC transporter ATP-binding protein [Biformimicrobium ophioploci]|uniref:ABC transporter ATP-binding protein n=1 Tax=Biformimicrobium ophioploci TaxID=3036711 RepID=A0ABQ6M0Z3_9GAMM|nr:ABC transporter ATP-binding protein [Microbulbifer sp. NKW57]GMG88016.1 ABC transporter ATP-binding protein [Microbulbifer sp. NKW57]